MRHMHSPPFLFRLLVELVGVIENLLGSIRVIPTRYNLPPPLLHESLGRHSQHYNSIGAHGGSPARAAVTMR